MTRNNLMLAAAMLCCCTPVSAGSARGTSAFQFLQLGVGARAVAMGAAFAGVAGDVNALYWNPAGLAAMERAELSMTHTLWLEDITYSNIAFGRRALGGTVGLAFNILRTGDIGKADNTGLQLNENYSMSDKMGLVSYARGWGNLALGANFKYIYSGLEDEGANSYAVDLGALYSGLRPWNRKLNLGLSVQNIGAKAKYVSEAAPLPLLIRAGGSLAVINGLLAAADLDYLEKEINFHIGAEYARPMGSFVLAARAGYKNDTVKELGALSGLAAGLGVNWGDCQLDYAWNSFTDLGITHRISLGLKFEGKEVKTEPVTPLTAYSANESNRR